MKNGGFLLELQKTIFVIIRFYEISKFEEGYKSLQKWHIKKSDLSGPFTMYDFATLNLFWVWILSDLCVIWIFLVD